MNCPVCHHGLTELSVARITVDVCKGGCGGIWFDNFELAKFDKVPAGAGEELLHVPVDPKVHIDHRKRRRCPRCDDMPLRRHFYNPKHMVEVDSCPNCGGFWLDAGEFAGIRAAFKSDADRQKAVKEYVDSVAGPMLAQMRTQGRGKSRTATTIESLLEFVGLD